MYPADPSRSRPTDMLEDLGRLLRGKRLLRILILVLLVLAYVLLPRASSSARVAGEADSPPPTAASPWRAAG